MIRLLLPILAFAWLLPASVQADRREADRAALRDTLEDILARQPLANARVGVKVVSLDDGSVVFSRNADDLLNPASNVKLFTSAAALSLLGSSYRFETEFLVPKPASRHTPLLTPSGELKGNLYVRGKGDPSITNEKLWGIVNALYHSGLRKVSGDLVLDDSYFDDELDGPGYDQENSDRAYMSPPGALSINWNTIAVYVGPGEKVGAKARVEVEPSSPFFKIENHATTGRPRQLRRLAISSIPAGDQQRIVVRGRIPAGHYISGTWKKIDNPTMYFGHSLREALALKGIKIRGKVRRGRAPDPARALYVHLSDPLDQVLKRVNKNSSNFTAEMLIKTLGAEFRGLPGSWHNGIDVVEQFLAEEVGIPRGTYVMKNGSGLNDTNRFSASQTCTLLKYMIDRFPIAPEYLSSLGIAGKDGTLHSRMSGTDAVGRLRAKTGTLENVTALSGYVQAVGGERFIFSLMVNDYVGRAGPVVRTLDAIGASIAETGGPGGPAAGVAKAMGPPPKAGSEAELKARIATYESLASMNDRRNLAFLRTALRNEPDPALKAVVADAMYRSDPEDRSATRALLDSFDPGPDVLGRLLKATRELVLPTPLVGSLARIAAEGNDEALTRIVELAAMARQDDLLAAELAESLTEVSRSAPHELIVALKSAQEATREAALDFIASSLSAAGEADHPFPAAVRRTQGSVDPELAAFARELDAALSIRVAAEKAPPDESEEATSGNASSAPSPEAKAPELRPGG